ncbi:MAG: nucleotidyl transferase AbiEii/AbiGii toxin family protein [Candidatus Aenigmarchaeota archaeon]|nr:nucleotidyl transferase AbiEii/AbiGii toxin family protein [Candidatus Aenigmarchaeota archaeon]
MIPKEMLVEAAKRKGLKNREHIEKDYFQDLFLYHLCRKTNALVFKGGTALYKIYSLQRFSEDLDFSLLGKTDVRKRLRVPLAWAPRAQRR